MNESREIRASRLFDAIGDIEDRYIAEAETAYAPKKRWVLLTRLLPVALCLTIFVGVYVALMAGNGAKTEDNALVMADMDRSPLSVNGAMTESTTTSGTLSTSALLLQILSSATAEEGNAESVDTASRLVWKKSGEDTYHTVALTAEQTEKLIDKMAKNTGGTPATSDALSLRVWIVCADGRVLTPYLLYKETDPPQREFFAYDPQIEPSAEWVEQIEAILN